MFTKMIAVLEVLAAQPNGATVGQIASMNTAMGLSRGQWQRVISGLMDEGFIRETTEKHGRTGKRVFHINESAVHYCSYVTRAYNDSGR